VASKKMSDDGKHESQEVQLQEGKRGNSLQRKPPMHLTREAQRE